MSDIGGPEVQQAEQKMGEISVAIDILNSDGHAVESLGDLPGENDAQNYADNCTS